MTSLYVVVSVWRREREQSPACKDGGEEEKEEVVVVMKGGGGDGQL